MDLSVFEVKVNRQRVRVWEWQLGKMSSLSLILNGIDSELILKMLLLLPIGQGLQNNLHMENESKNKRYWKQEQNPNPARSTFLSEVFWFLAKVKGLKV
jgi:hypothetical protein